MDNPRRKSTRHDMYYGNEVNTRLTAKTTVEKIQDLRVQLEEVIASASNKRARRTPKRTRLAPLTTDQSVSPSLSFRESRDAFPQSSPIENDCQVDAKVLAYKKFISSLTRIIQDANRHTLDSFSVSTSFNVQNVKLGTDKRSAEEKGTFLVQNDLLAKSYVYENQGMYGIQRAEKTTYCRPVTCSEEFINRPIEQNAKLHELVKKLAQAREKEKQIEAWNNYINELKNKHGHHDFQNRHVLRFIEKENDETPNFRDDNYVIEPKWKPPNICGHMFNDAYKTTNYNNDCEMSNMRSNNWYIPSTSKLYNYEGNCFCCPISSQGRLMMLNRQRCGAKVPQRYWRGSTIVVEKQLPCGRETSVMKSYGTIKSRRRRPDMWQYKAMQTDSKRPDSKLNPNQPGLDRNFNSKSLELDTPDLERHSNRLGQKTSDSKLNPNAQDRNSLDSKLNPDFRDQNSPDPDLKSNSKDRNLSESDQYRQISSKNKSNARNGQVSSMQLKFDNSKLNANSQDSNSLDSKLNPDSRDPNSPDSELKSNSQDPNSAESNENRQTISKNKSNAKNSQISSVQLKFDEFSGNAEKLKRKLSGDDNNRSSLVKLEQKLDTLIDAFNALMKELKLKNVTKADVQSGALTPCCSMDNPKMYKIKSDTYNVLAKHNIMCDVAQQKPHSTVSFSPCPINQDTINDILNEEKDKSDKVKKDIDKILHTSQCAVQIIIDIPTKEDSTEVTSSFYKRQQEEMIMEEVEPIENEELKKIERTMTIAVNTDPMGILALWRVSAETVKQILSYVPNLNYVTYLARRQLGNSNAVARYVCNICSATFTRPSTLSDHIQGHNVDQTKRDCCVCRHVLDQLSHRSGLFPCPHCGQVFTRAYCRELHQQSCTMGPRKRDPRPSLIMLT